MPLLLLVLFDAIILRTMKKAVSQKSLKQRVTRREWKLRMRISKGILNENCPQSNLLPPPDKLSDLYDVAHSTNWQGIYV